MSLLREEEPNFGFGTLCELFGYSRLTYYKSVENDGFIALALDPIIVE